MIKQSLFTLNRRRLLQMGTGAIAITTLPGLALADEKAFQASRKAAFGNSPIKEGRVEVTLPPIAENGNSVPITVKVNSPMTDASYVKRIIILSPRNPVPDMSHYKLGPDAGRAEVSTRIRLAGTQSIEAIAEMSDGSLWSGSKSTVVTLAACAIL